jgi:hypothetical protein
MLFISKNLEMILPNQKDQHYGLELKHLKILSFGLVVILIFILKI